MNPTNLPRRRAHAPDSDPIPPTNQIPPLFLRIRATRAPHHAVAIRGARARPSSMFCFPMIRSPVVRLDGGLNLLDGHDTVAVHDPSVPSNASMTCGYPFRSPGPHRQTMLFPEWLGAIRVERRRLFAGAHRGGADPFRVPNQMSDGAPTPRGAQSLTVPSGQTR